MYEHFEGSQISKCSYMPTRTISWSSARLMCLRSLPGMRMRPALSISDVAVSETTKCMKRRLCSSSSLALVCFNRLVHADRGYTLSDVGSVLFRKTTLFSPAFPSRHQRSTMAHGGKKRPFSSHLQRYSP